MASKQKNPLEITEQSETVEFELNKEKYKLTISNNSNDIEIKLEELFSMKKNEYFLKTNLKDLQNVNRFFGFFTNLNEVNQSLIKLVRKNSIDISKDDAFCKFKIINPVNDEEFFIELTKLKNDSKASTKEEMNDSIPLIAELKKKIENLEAINQDLVKRVESLEQKIGNVKNIERKIEVIKDIKEENEEVDVADDGIQLFKSSLIGKKDEKAIKTFLQGKSLSAELIFDTAVDGDTLEAFKKKCEGQFPTLIIIKTDLGKIFGGYATCPWKENGPIPDYDSFIFTLNPNAKYAITMPKYALFGYNKKENIMFQFGLVGFRIDGNCTSTRKNVIRGSNYEKGFLNFIGGDHKFQVSRLEIFKLTF